MVLERISSGVRHLTLQLDENALPCPCRKCQNQFEIFYLTNRHWLFMIRSNSFDIKFLTYRNSTFWTYIQNVFFIFTFPVDFLLWSPVGVQRVHSAPSIHSSGFHGFFLTSGVSPELSFINFSSPVITASKNKLFCQTFGLG